MPDVVQHVREGSMVADWVVVVVLVDALFCFLQSTVGCILALLQRPNVFSESISFKVKAILSGAKLTHNFAQTDFVSYIRVPH